MSHFPAQLASAGGAEVMSTTSSDEKTALLHNIGSKDGIDYKEDSEWGLTAKKLSNLGRGADYGLEIGGRLFYYMSNNESADKVRTEYYGVVFACFYDVWNYCCGWEKGRNSWGCGTAACCFGQYDCNWKPASFRGDRYDY